ncbi:MAG TPA: helix-turn-helix domain-containing protein [Dongiaceae bacterium]|nr:helix-turn-helix domain-containing protein [Dongiaceae bacterium]
MIISHLRSDDTPEPERLAAWRDFLGRKVFRVNIDPLPESRFFIDATLHRLPGLALVSAVSSGAVSHRPAELLDGDDVVLNIVRAGICTVTQRGREVVCRSGEAVLMSSTDPCTVLRPADAQVLTLSLPRMALAPLMADTQGAVMRHIPADSATLKLLIHYLDTMPIALLRDNPALQKIYVDHAYELVALATAPMAESAGVAGSCVRVARLQAAKLYIENNLHEPGLSPLTVAGAIGISVRQLHQLFVTMECSFMRYVMARRLEHCRRILESAAHRHRSIADIAFHHGFDSLATFYRAFKKAYHHAPADYRAIHCDSPRPAR